MALTRPQLEAQILARITDPLNRQNTALLVRECFNLLALHCFNLAEDELTLQQVTGLATALMGKADLVSGKVPASQLPDLSTFWGALAKSSTNSQTIDQAIAAAVASLVASSPAALDTLNEFAQALGNDANFSATITAAIAERIPLTQKAQPNGVATLDANGFIPDAQIPASVKAVGTIETSYYFKGETEVMDRFIEAVQFEVIDPGALISPTIDIAVDGGAYQALAVGFNLAAGKRFKLRVTYLTGIAEGVLITRVKKL